MIAHRIFDLALWQLVQLSIAIAAVAIVTRIFCRRRPALAYALWLLVLVKSLTPPIWNSPIDLFSWPARTHGRTPALPMPHPQTIVSSVVTAAQPHQRPRSRTWQPWQMVLAIWTCGCFGMSLTIAVRSRLLARRIAKSSVPPPSELTQILESTCRRLGSRRRPALRVCTWPIGPAVFGILRPTLVLPAAIAAENDAAQLRIIIAHEILHLRRRDPLVAAVQLLSQCVWWFHPLAWWMNRQINQAREMCCDVQVIANLRCPPADYAQVLIDVLRLRRTFDPMPLSLGIRSAQVTARRIDHIMNDAGNSPRRISWLHRSLVVLCALLILPSIGGVSPGAATTQPDRPPTEPNKALYDFLGEPVAPPAGLNPAYSKDGLTKAVQRAAQKAGVSLKRIMIDDSEFPFLVGVVCAKGDVDKLNDPIGKMAGYSYSGSVSSDTCKAMNIIPYRFFPRRDGDRIERRMNVRMEMLYYRLLSEPMDRNAAKTPVAPASQPAEGI